MVVTLRSSSSLALQAIHASSDIMSQAFKQAPLSSYAPLHHHWHTGRKAVTRPPAAGGVPSPGSSIQAFKQA
jgi:hypothetical protein